jgi:uncharacterized damage-inducible protein DinB
MTTIEALAAEFEHETATLRRHLERVPEDRFDWRPHKKSFSAGELASHLVDCVGWTELIFGADEYVFDPASFQPFAARSSAELLDALDSKVANGRRALGAATHGDVDRPWRLKIGERVRFERPKAVVFRGFTLSHLIHHRGQLSVYLRLLEVPVPGSYGPSADEQG